MNVRAADSLIASFQSLRPSIVLGAALALWVCGCGTTISRSATEQLLTSDAVDRSISEIDFRYFAGRKVYLDTQYLQKANGVGVVNSDYVISSLRQQIVAAHCLLQDKKEDAEIVLEARIGALATNSHEVIYGVPANNLLTAASSFVPMMPTVPTMPEISVAKRHDQFAAAKVSVFAYDRDTREPVWQSGLSVARSKAKDSWVMGAGPFQSGTIYEGTQFAGQRLGFSSLFARSAPAQSEPLAAYREERLFTDLERAVPPPPADIEPRRPVQAAEEQAVPAEIERTGHTELDSQPGPPPSQRSQ